MAKQLKPNVYVELGVYESSLFNKMIPYVNSKLYAVDINKDLEKFMKKNKKTTFVNTSTDKFGEFLEKENIKIDMLFIDADHKKELVLKDFKKYFPFIKDDGIIFLHDGYPKNIKYTKDGYCLNCYEAIFELSKNTTDYEMTTIPLHPGLTICRKKTNSLGIG